MKGTQGANKECEQPVCKDSNGVEQVNYYVSSAGVCTKCADYFKADDTKRDCAPGNLQNLGEGKSAAQFILQKDGTAKECTYAKPDATQTFKVNGVDYNIKCKDTVCDADLAETAVKRKIVKENGDCETCPDTKKTDPTDPKKCADVVCATKGWGPNKLAVCVDLQLELVNALPDGVTKANVQAAQKVYTDMLVDVKKSVDAMKALIESAIKVTWGLV